MNTKTFLILVMLLMISRLGYTQKIYAYGSLKLPLGDYIAYALDQNAINQKNDGVIADIGGGINIRKNMAIEAGISYFAYNTLSKPFFTDNTLNEKYQEITTYNQAFSFQATPVYIVSLDKESETKWRIAIGIQYQKQYTQGRYDVFEKDLSGKSVLKNSYTQNQSSAFKLNVVPTTGIDFTLNKNLILGFELNLIRVNWNKAMDKLMFYNDQKTLIIPTHQTYNLFFTGRITLK